MVSLARRPAPLVSGLIRGPMQTLRIHFKPLRHFAVALQSVSELAEWSIAIDLGRRRVETDEHAYIVWPVNEVVWLLRITRIPHGLHGRGIEHRKAARLDDNDITNGAVLEYKGHANLPIFMCHLGSLRIILGRGALHRFGHLRLEKVYFARAGLRWRRRNGHWGWFSGCRRCRGRHDRRLDWPRANLPRPWRVVDNGPVGRHRDWRCRG